MEWNLILPFAIQGWHSFHLSQSTMDVTVDKFGRIVIPKPVRDWLGLKAGTELHLEVTEQATGERAIALRPAEEKPLLVEEDGLLIYSGALLVENFDVVEHLRSSRQDRAVRLAGLRDRTG